MLVLLLLRGGSSKRVVAIAWSDLEIITFEDFLDQITENHVLNIDRVYANPQSNPHLSARLLSDPLLGERASK